MIRYRARWVLPIARPPIADGVVAVDRGTISYVGAARDAPPGVDEDLGDALLLPGLVNVHTHLELTVMRGYLEQLPFPDWIRALTRAREAVLTESSLLDSARLGIAEGVRAGITTYADTSPHAGIPLRAMREGGVRGIVYQEVFGPEPSQCAAAVAELRDAVQHLRAEETALVGVGVSPHAPYSVSDGLFAATARLAVEESLPIAVHASESAAESALVRRGKGPFAAMLRKRGIAVAPRGQSSIDLLERNGVLGAHPLLIHCVRASDDDLRRIAVCDAAVAHCPTSNAKLGHGIAPLLEMLDSGIRVGLGSDSVASNNRMDLLDEARLAVILQCARVGRTDALSAARVLELATLGGARALGLDDRIGSLEQGKAADLVAFDLRHARGAAVYDPEATAVFSLSGADAFFVSVDGRVLLRGSRPVVEDRGLPERVRQVAESLVGWTGRHRTR